MELKKIIEAILFSSSKPVAPKLLKKRLEEYPPQEIEEALRELTTEYNNLDRAAEIAEVAGGFQMKTKPVYKEWVTRFVKEKDVGLTKSMLETLSIIAYKQPVTKKDIDNVRGVDSTRAIKLLLERKLINIAGKNEDAGKKIIFRTTDKFLEVYGLRSIEDLPTYKDLESLELEPKVNGMVHGAQGLEHKAESAEQGAEGVGYNPERPEIDECIEHSAEGIKLSAESNEPSVENTAEDAESAGQDVESNEHGADFANSEQLENSEKSLATAEQGQVNSE
jgi:segregation and condensation protein B